MAKRMMTAMMPVSVGMAEARMAASDASGDGADDALAGPLQSFSGVRLQHDDGGHGEPVAVGERG